MEDGDKRLQQASRRDPRPLIERVAENLDLPRAPSTPPSETDAEIHERPRTSHPVPDRSPGPAPRKPRKVLPWMRARAKARTKT